MTVNLSAVLPAPPARLSIICDGEYRAVWVARVHIPNYLDPVILATGGRIDEYDTATEARMASEDAARRWKAQP